MKEKQAVLAVSFGTSYPDTLAKTIQAIENDLGAAFPARTLRRAFTSGMILKVWRDRDGIEMDDVPRALARLEEEGYTDVILQPTHIMNGAEFDKLIDQAAPFAGRMKLAVGDPLLTRTEDYKAVAAALTQALEPPAEDEALIFMGHGTDHHANSAYTQMEYVFHDLGWKRVFFGTVEGYPELEEAFRRLAERPQIRRVRLQPFMVVAGDHAVHDMAGPEADSWKSRLEGAGYTVTCALKGLGEYSGIRTVFVEHARRAE